MKKYLFFIFWIGMILFLGFISLRYRSRTEALVAQVESQTTAISFSKPVIIETLFVVPGQEVKQGDTLLIVARLDLSIDIERKLHEIEQIRSEQRQNRLYFESRTSLIDIESENKLNKLNLDLNEVTAKINQQKYVEKNLSGLISNSNEASISDSLLLARKISLDAEIQHVNEYVKFEKSRLKLVYVEKGDFCDKQLLLAQQEWQSLIEEQASLVKTAASDGVVGIVNVQLGELLPPFTTLVSIYERNPTMIKAFMNEALKMPVKSGDSVKVASENRLYEVKGVVQELGARVTSYPDKIRPVLEIPSYGQEVFIRIPPSNSFLNGEKVFVYPIEK
jgi:multidrug resistance efflux pump